MPRRLRTDGLQAPDEDVHVLQATAHLILGHPVLIEVGVQAVRYVEEPIELRVPLSLSLAFPECGKDRGGSDEATLCALPAP